MKCSRLESVLLIVLLQAIRPSLETCRDLDVYERTLRDSFREQPLYLKFIVKTEENEQLDNVCYTLFTLPDNNHTYIYYSSIVYRNGTTMIQTAIVTQVRPGVQRSVSPTRNSRSYVLGPAGCKTNVYHTCNVYEDIPSYGTGTSSSRTRLKDECLRKAEEILQEQEIFEKYTILPMQRPSRCVMQQSAYRQGDGH